MFTAALARYQEKTGIDPMAHPLFQALEGCGSVDTVISVLKEQAREFGHFRKSKLTKWLKPLVGILLTVNNSLGEGVSLVS